MPITQPPTEAWQVSIRRADYWLVEGMSEADAVEFFRVSIRRADYWLVEGLVVNWFARVGSGFNPPGGLLVG